MPPNAHDALMIGGLPLGQARSLFFFFLSLESLTHLSHGAILISSCQRQRKDVSTCMSYAIEGPSDEADALEANNRRHRASLLGRLHLPRVDLALVRAVASMRVFLSFHLSSIFLFFSHFFKWITHNQLESNKRKLSQNLPVHTR